MDAMVIYQWTSCLTGKVYSNRMTLREALVYMRQRIPAINDQMIVRVSDGVILMQTRLP